MWVVMIVDVHPPGEGGVAGVHAGVPDGLDMSRHTESYRAE